MTKDILVLPMPTLFVAPVPAGPGGKDMPMFDSIQDLNKFLLLALLLVVTIGYTGRKAGKLRRKKRRAQYRNLTRPTALTHDAINEAGDEPQ